MNGRCLVAGLVCSAAVLGDAPVEITLCNPGEVQESLVARAVQAGELLGFVIAHELGHLLLGAAHAGD